MGDLCCNKCRNKVKGFAWVTSCSHFFCDDDGQQAFKEGLSTCPVCNTELSQKFDAIRMNTNPQESYRSMVLAGLSPDIVLEVATRAISFFTFQVSFELAFQEHKSAKGVAKMDQAYQALFAQSQTEIEKVNAQNRELREQYAKLQGELHNVQEQLGDRTRQYHRLQVSSLSQLRCSPHLNHCRRCMIRCGALPWARITPKTQIPARSPSR
eukprot:m.47752 g.47752  ORF g.47752 m.47752 type:complete len:211 (+) comp11297_c0_seq1:24-656(+)